MSANGSIPVALRLAEREFLIACAPEERDGLLEAADFLDRKMRELRAHAKSPGFDRLAVLAAISIAHECLALRRQNAAAEEAAAERLHALSLRLDAALEAHTGR